MIAQAGGNLLSDDGKSVTMNSQAGIDALSLWTDMALKDKTQMVPAGNNPIAWPRNFRASTIVLRTDVSEEEEIRLPRLKRTATVLLLTLLLSLMAGFATRGEAQAAQPGGGCNANNVHGMCFDTLPRLYCCSPAFLGWSGIYVGDRFPVSGKIGGGIRSDSLTMVYPSGRTASLPVTEGAAFRGDVSFDEEGQYTLQWTGPQGDVMKRVFYVAYQV
ncbi:MAG: hypothetical protein JWN15_3286, partial [Firmicutes bacterium]|nr:hypothetical protein [Bacillota bacterium]